MLRVLTSSRAYRLRRDFRSCSSSTKQLPEEANVIVVGGGIIGTSVAYHLAKLGVEDVLLLERDRLTSGTTWHAAGLMNSFGSMSQTSTWMRQYTKDLYRNILPEETGLSAGFMEIGFIELACDADRLHAYQRTAAFNRYCGVDVHEISPEEVKERFPLCDTSSVLAGFWVESDGRANPTDATMALARGARMHGVDIREGVRVAGVVRSSGPRVQGVELVDGSIIRANQVVNCAGMWARQFAEACGLHSIPNQAAEHYYLITEPMDVDPSWPVIEDSSRYVYIRPEGEGLMLGLFEAEGACWKADGVPNDFSFGEMEPDWDRMAPYIEKAVELVPDVNNVGIRTLFCGPESFTPDGSPIVGQSREFPNYYVAAGLNSLGILTGGGIGQILARWVMRDGAKPTDVDVTGMDATRFHDYQNNPVYRQTKVGEVLGETYKVHYPNHQPHTCRNAKLSPLHGRLERARAHFRDVSGWESPAWYAPPGVEPVVHQESFDRENWFDYWAAEHNACRQGVALFDMSFMSKFLVTGRSAGAFLSRLSTANVDGLNKRITYTQWLTEDGFMAADVTVLKRDEESFFVVATDTQHQQVLHHMRQRLGSSEHVWIHDATSQYSQINLQGPRSRALLQKLTTSDLSNDAFSFRTSQEIDLGLARVVCSRITYVGELGYELLVPVEQAVHVYDEIVRVGSEVGLQHAGLKALGSLRLEKGYRDYGHDMDNTDTLVDCGLSFTCDFTKAEGFIGQEHVAKQKSDAEHFGGLQKRMVSVLVEDPNVLLHHGEVLWRNGHRNTDIRAGSYGHTLGGSVGLAMVQDSESPITKSYLQDGEWEVEVGNQRYPCHVSVRPFYDPRNERIRK